MMSYIFKKFEKQLEFLEAVRMLFFYGISQTYYYNRSLQTECQIFQLPQRAFGLNHLQNKNIYILNNSVI